MRLLSVDWDFFFPIPNSDPYGLYDWGHHENMAFMVDGIWAIRAANFQHAKLRLPGTSGEEATFWQRFRFAPGARLYYTDSHCRIARPEVRAGITEVWNFDAHHDAYKPAQDVLATNTVACDTWATAFHLMGIKVRTFFPAWHGDYVGRDKPAVSMPAVQVDRGQAFNRLFDGVFVCRSGAWTPTWIEDAFWQFIAACPVTEHHPLDDIAERQFVVADMPSPEELLQ